MEDSKREKGEDYEISVRDGPLEKGRRVDDRETRFPWSTIVLVQSKTDAQGGEGSERGTQDWRGRKTAFRENGQQV